MNRRRFITMALVGAAAACAGRNTVPLSSRPRTTLKVENQSYLEMTIYLISGAQRVRLGNAQALSTTSLTIPPQYVFGPSQLQFMADPIGSNRTPISDTITVSPGDEVRLIIPSRT